MIALALALSLLPLPQDTLDFETDSGWESAHTGAGKPARWKRVEDPEAPSGRFALMQEDADATDYRFVMALHPNARIRSGTVWVRFKPAGGSVDRAGGLVWRYRDANNYYVARANALEGNLRIYKVVDGKRIQLAHKKTQIAENVWHTIVARFDENRHVVSLDEAVELEVEDDQFPDAGLAGLWTKSDSLTFFDDLTILPRAPEAVESKLWLALLSLGDPRQGFHTCRRLREEGRGENEGEAARLLEWHETPDRILQAVQDAADWRARLVRGALQIRLNQKEAALATFDSILQERPGCLEALLGRARARTARAKAWRDAELAVALHPRAISALCLLASLCVAEKKLPQAHALLDRALAIDDRCVPAILIRGSAYLAANEPKKAILEFDRAIRIDPHEPRAYYNRSLAWELEGNHDRAMKNAQKAADLAPELPDPRHQMGRLYTLQPDYDAAEREFQKALRIDPAYAKAAIGLGWVEAHRGKYEEAIKRYDLALQQDPSIAEGWALRGNAKWKLKRVDAAIADYSKAIEINPSLAIAWANRGWAYAYQNQWAAAVSDFERALSLEPALQPAILGELERAKKQLAQQEY